jgi:tetratricopeptide (TPR) repeat protein
MALKTPLATGFWREYYEWRERLRVAERQKRIGDILLLTDEIRNPLIKEDAILEAGWALRNMGRHDLALNQYRKGLGVNERNLIFRRQEAFSLNRLGKVDEAIVKIESVLAETPGDQETVAQLGRIYKEMWINSWTWIDDKKLRTQTAFDSYHWLLKSFQTYLRGYQLDLNEFYPGVMR